MAPLLVYDGECGFCTRCAEWVATRAPEVEVVPWQELDLDAIGLTEDQVRTAAYWVDGTTVVGAERAVASALRACGGAWSPLGRALLLPGVRRVAGVAYRYVARHRGRFSRLLRQKRTQR